MPGASMIARVKLILPQACGSLMLFCDRGHPLCNLLLLRYCGSHCLHLSGRNPHPHTSVFHFPLIHCLTLHWSNRIRISLYFLRPEWKEKYSKSDYYKEAIRHNERLWWCLVVICITNSRMSEAILYNTQYQELKVVSDQKINR